MLVDTPGPGASPRRRVPLGSDSSQPGLGGAGRRGDLGQRPAGRAPACVTEDARQRVVGVGPQRPARDRRAVGPADRRAPSRRRSAGRTSAPRDRADRARGSGPRRLRCWPRTGLPLDPMFSALKAGWLLDAHDPDRTAHGAGRLACRHHRRVAARAASAGSRVTEIGNASRTQLLNLDTGDWDESLLDLFGVPRARPAAGRGLGRARSRRSAASPRCPTACRCSRCMADSHAALFAHAGLAARRRQGDLRHGSSVMALGPRAVRDLRRLCDGRLAGRPTSALALEANIRSTGRTLTWLADLLGVDVDDLLFEAARAAEQRRRHPGAGIRRARRAVVGPRRDAAAQRLVPGHPRRDTWRERRWSRSRSRSTTRSRPSPRCRGPLAELACDGGMTRSADADAAPGRHQRPPGPGELARPTCPLWGSPTSPELQLGWWSRADLEGGSGCGPDGPHLEQRLLRIGPESRERLTLRASVGHRGRQVPPDRRPRARRRRGRAS